MRNWSIPLGRVFGVEIRLHLTFVLLLGFVWVTQTAAPHGGTPEQALALVGIILGSVVLHELGHALAAWRSDSPVRSIILLPIGGVTLLDETARRAPGGNLRIALAGPAANLMVAAVAGGIMVVLGPRDLWQPPLIDASHLARTGVWINVFLGAFNLLPAYPLDGGRVLRALLLRRYDPMLATRRALGFGQFFSSALLFAGMGGAIYGQDWSYWLMLAGFFLFVGSQMEDRSAVFHAVLESVRMEDIMLTEFATLSPADTLEGALSKAVHSLQDDFPVVRGSELVGAISRQRILQALRTEGNGYVQSAMNRALELAQREDSLASVFRKITGRGTTLIPIVDGERLVGIVTLQILTHSMALLAETRKLQQG
jgi:Zn-dependent protease/CBS domain-containing protein